MASERYSEFHKKNALIYTLIIDEYLKNTTMNDDWSNEVLRKGCLHYLLTFFSVALESTWNFYWNPEN